jgi:hypothetical protein
MLELKPSRTPVCTSLLHDGDGRSVKMTSPNEVTLEDVKSWTPTDLRAWINQLERGASELPQGFNWLSLAEYLERNAFNDELPGGMDANWLPAAVAVRDFLIAVAPDETRESREVAAMMLRARAIHQLGAKRGDSILDPDVLRRWFKNSLSMSAADALTKTREWRTLSNQEREAVFRSELELLQHLRNTKNRLRVIDELARSPGFAVDDMLAEWIALRDQLH